MAKEAVNKIIEAENQGKEIKEQANIYLKETLDKAAKERKLLFEQKIAEAKTQTEDIIAQANKKAEEIIAASNETSKKEVHELKEKVLEQNDIIVSEIIELV